MSEQPLEFPKKTASAIRRLQLVAIAQQRLLDDKKQWQVLGEFMDEGIPKIKANEYIGIAKSRIKRGLPLPDVPKRPDTETTEPEPIETESTPEPETTEEETETPEETTETPTSESTTKNSYELILEQLDAQTIRYEELLKALKGFKSEESNEQ